MKTKCGKTKPQKAKHQKKLMIMELFIAFTFPLTLTEKSVKCILIVAESITLLLVAECIN